MSSPSKVRESKEDSLHERRHPVAKGDEPSRNLRLLSDPARFNFRVACLIAYMQQTDEQ